MHITYITKLGPLGRSYTTRIDYGQSWSQAELDERVSAVCGLPPEQCAAVGRQYFLELLQAESPRPICSLFSLLNAEPCCSGSAPTPEDFHDAHDIKADIRISYISSVIDDWRAASSVEKTGHDRPRLPVIETVLNALTKGKETYTPGQMIRVQGKFLPFNRLVAEQGIFIATGEAGPWTRLDTYGPITGLEVYAFIPASTAGGLRVKVVNEALYEFVYPLLLQAEPSPA